MTAGAVNLEIATPEAVALSIEVAGIGHRALAWLVDAGLLALAWFTLLFATSYLRTFDLSRFGGLETWIQVALVLAVFAANWGYALLFEAIWQGQTPGKRAMKIRVVREDGAPASLVELALRNLCRAVDFLPAFYAVGVLAMFLSPRSRRLGDLAAGTLVVRERRIDLDRYAPPPAARNSARAPLAPDQLELVLNFVSRAEELEPAARARLAVKLAHAFAARLPGPEREVLGDPIRAEAFLRALGRGEA